MEKGEAANSLAVYFISVWLLLLSQKMKNQKESLPFIVIVQQ